MKIGVVLAARMGSSRLPRKAMLPLLGRPMVGLLMERLAGSREADVLILATTQLPADDALVDLATAHGFEVFRGSEEDVVDRFVHAASAHDLDYVVRVTGDCPLMDAATLDYCVAACRALVPFDLASTKGHFPVGIDCEVYQTATMAALHGSGKLTPEDREHLTLYLYKNSNAYRVLPLYPPKALERVAERFTVDTPADYGNLLQLLSTCDDPLVPLQQLFTKGGS
jgi:spore coat polysaccharide biosynthesis protein SpsF